MSATTAQLPRVPVFRCAECGAAWRTEMQRALCCTAQPEPQPPRLWETLIAYREQQQAYEAQRRKVSAAAIAAYQANAAAEKEERA